MVLTLVHDRKRNCVLVDIKSLSTMGLPTELTTYDLAAAVLNIHPIKLNQLDIIYHDYAPLLSEVE